MSTFSSLRNLLPKQHTKPAATPTVASSEREPPVEFVDAQGTRIFVARQEYRDRVLPGIFSDAHDHPDSLYQRIIQALDDGFLGDCLEPARRLVAIDHDPERSQTVLGIVLLKNRRLEEAKTLYESFLQEHGESAVMLTNLAKVYAEQGKDSLANETLWKSLTLDPNIANAVVWYAAIANDRGGPAAYLDALNRVAAIPGSWHAQLWIAREELERGEKEAAMAIYRRVLPQAASNADALMMISGDLGKNGHAKDALDLILPVFDIAKHGHTPALNLLQACVELREKTTGSRLLAQLKNLQRPDLLHYVRHFEHALKSA